MAAERITKRYGSVTALNEVSTAFPQSGLHALLGENGAGKTTLAKVFAGVTRPQSGVVRVGDEPVKFRSPRDALTRGIGMVAQHPSLIPTMTVVENALYGHRASTRWLASRSSTRVELEELAQSLGFDAPLDVRVEQLSLGQRQRAEILRLLRRKADTLILDEPTDVLTPEESSMLFRAMRSFVATGGTVLVITHRIAEVFEHADTVTVLRDGNIAGERTTPVVDVDENTLLSWMLGRTYSKAPTKTVRARSDASCLQLTKVTSRGRVPVQEVSLSIGRGEIVGIAGVEGNGQEELAGVIAGTIAADAGTIGLGANEITHLSVAGRSRLGLAYVPADRHRDGLVLELSVAENLYLRQLIPGGVEPRRRGAIQRRELRARARELVAEYEIKCASVDDRLSNLSGGNQQKVVLAREAAGCPTVMVAAQPSRGLDVGARDFVHRQLRRLAGEGAGVLLISSDLDEAMKLSDRILVLARGQITGEFAGPQYDVMRIGTAMMGHK